MKIKKKVETYLQCVHCDKNYDIGELRYKCECGGLLDVKRNMDSLDGKFLKKMWDNRWGLKNGIEGSGVWRYKELILDAHDENIISKIEGNTRLYNAGSAGEYAGLNRFLLKHEGENPTGSFKDRGMTCGMTAAKCFGSKSTACASTGNTSASMAAYAVQGGLKPVIFIPEGKIAYGKLAQALAYGGLTIQIDGNFDDAMTLVQEITREKGIYLLNSINPFRIEGQKAIVIETLQQMDWEVPDWFIIPGGNLGNNTAMTKGLRELYDLGIIDKIPRVAVIQAEGANPLYTMWKNKSEYKAVHNPETIATAIKIGNPVSWEKSIKGIEWCNGIVEQVTEQEIMDAKAKVDGAGIGAEPASCCSVAGARKLVKSGIIDPDEKVVGILTGNILKDPDAIIGYHRNELKDMNIEGNFSNSPYQVGSDIDEINQLLEKKGI